LSGRAQQTFEQARALPGLPLAMPLIIAIISSPYL